MREVKFMVLVACVALTAPTALAQLDFSDGFDAYTVKAPPTAPWAIDDHWGDSYWVETAGKVRSAPYSILVNNKGYKGRDLGVQAPLDDGAIWNGSDDCPLELEYFVYYGSSKQQKEADYYVELSMGDVHAPPLPSSLGSQVPANPPLPVVAYCKPWNSGDGNKKVLFYFNGSVWGKAGNPGGGWNKMAMAVASSTITLGTSGTTARTYTGGFDSISIYTLDYQKGNYTSIDDVSVSGGYTTIEAGLDILPNDDPNYVAPNKKSKGRLPMAILGSEDLDVSLIDEDSILVADIVAPVKKTSLDDVNGDGFLDLVIHISRRDLIDALGLDLLEPGTEVDVSVSAKLGCDDVVATDVIVIQGLGD